MDRLLDAAGFVWFFGLFVGLPLLGWWAMVADFRAYLRGLRRALVAVRHYATTPPLWALRDRPECLRVLGVAPECTRDEVMAAYRERVKDVHPDLGGDRRRFERLQRALSDAIRLVEAREN